jgi:hypothetical protein
MTPQPLYKRVLLKASGEALMGSQGFGIDVAVADRIASDIAEVRGLGVEVGLSLAAAIFSAALRLHPKVVTGLPVITWACWQP